MTPAQLARDAVRVVDRLERAQVRRIRELLASVERDLRSLLPALATGTPTTSRALTELRVRQALAQSTAAQAMLDMGRSNGPLATAFRQGIQEAHADGIRSATAAAIDRGIAPALADRALAFGSRVDLDLINSIASTTVTTLERVGQRGLANIEDALVRAAVRGVGPRAAGRLVRESFDLTRYEAERITRTVFMRANNEARDETYRRMGVTRVQFDATNDKRTCEYCEARHGMVYKVTDSPKPPLHPNCRCVLIPWREDTAPANRGDAYYERTRDELARTNAGRKTVSATAAAPFERADGIKPPEPVWRPRGGPTTLTRAPAWRPSMSAAEADAFTSGSAYREPVYHVTSAENVDSLVSEGFNLDRTAFGRIYGDGAYLALDTVGARVYETSFRNAGTASARLQLRANVARPFDYRETVAGAATRDRIAEAAGAKAKYDALLREQHAANWRVITRAPGADLGTVRAQPSTWPGVLTFSGPLPADVVKARSQYFEAARAAGRYVPDPEAGAFTRALRDAGYDSLIVRPAGVPGSDEYRSVGGPQLIVFDPRKVVIVRGGD